MDYKLQKDGSVQRMSDKAFIPAEPGNIDWQEYQVWIRQGNTPQEADS